MALAADHLLRCGGAQLARGETAVLVVALGAGEQLLLHAMMKWARELGRAAGVAAGTQLRLRLSQQQLPRLRRRVTPGGGVVNGVTVKTSDLSAFVCRAPEVAVFFRVLVALEAALRDFAAREMCEADYFLRIAERIGVRAPGAVAGL